ncbi:MAG TPA: nuclear transport factor 2 family protein [Chthoniobacteraceae bacterium]|jgi:ketosteroid isomerase-like protein|nr:nuclear transport factor 2 family protein [Chthoniobacteraceae bacterium]
MKYRLFALLLLFPLFAHAQEDPAHAELRTMRDGLLAAMNKGDIEAQLAYLHPNVVVTWHNAEVSRGTDGVRAYLQKQLTGATKQVEKFAVETKVDELSIIYGGDTAIAFGSAQEYFTLASGRAFALNGRWSATMVKENGRWLVASLHTSDNIFDNPLLNQLKGFMPWVGGASLIMGMLLGWLVARRGMAK